LLLCTSPAQPLLAELVLSVLSVSSLLGTVVLGAWLDVWDRWRTLVFCNLALAPSPRSSHWPPMPPGDRSGALHRC
jgi:hypothetical protein